MCYCIFTGSYNINKSIYYSFTSYNQPDKYDLLFLQALFPTLALHFSLLCEVEHTDLK